MRRQLGAAVAALGLLGAASCAGSTSTAPRPSPSPSPAPRIATAERIGFVVRGHVAAPGLVIDYGCTAGVPHHVERPALAGRVVYWLRFRPRPGEVYYARAWLSGPGRAAVAIVVTGRGMYPTTVARGVTRAAGGLAVAAAAPDDSHGTHWIPAALSVGSS